MKTARVLWAPVRWERRSWKQRSECMKEVHLLQGLAENYLGELIVLIEHFPKHHEVQFYLQVKWNFFQMDIILSISHMRETKAQRCCHLSTQHMEQNQDEDTAPRSHFCYNLRRMKETHKARRGIVHIILCFMVFLLGMPYHTIPPSKLSHTQKCWFAAVWL